MQICVAQHGDRHRACVLGMLALVLEELSCAVASNHPWPAEDGTWLAKAPGTPRQQHALHTILLC